MKNVARSSLLVVVLAQGLAGCGGSSLPSTPSVPSPAQQPAPQPIPSFQVSGHVYDAVDRALEGATVEVLDGPQVGTVTTSDAAGAFSLTGSFDEATRFRASRAGYITASKFFRGIATTRAIGFFLDGVAAPVNIAGDYRVTFVADSACAEFPSDVRTRTYLAAIRPDPHFPLQPSHFRAQLSGASLDGYYNTIGISVTEDFIRFDMSDNFILEEVSPDAYLTIGGVGGTAVSASVESTISAPFQGTFDYCKTTAEPDEDNNYSCLPDLAIAHAQCSSKNHQLILTRR
jgi:hypothetical protein